MEDAADGLQRPDPLKPVNRATIQEAVQKFVAQIELTKDPLTCKAYEQNLRQYLEWTNLIYVDQIDKDHLFEFRKHVMDGGNESLTADWKLLRINKMVKTSLKSDHGKGPIRKSDLGKMRPNGDPETYTAQQLQVFFGACRPHENLRYSALHETAFRKEELMYLEKDDVLVAEQMLRVKSKERRDVNGEMLYKYEAKADSERNVPISRELMNRIVRHMNSHNHRLAFCTREGTPDTHLWDKVKSIAKRAKLDPTCFNLKKFRSTRATEWLRPRWLGGFGYDIPTVKRLLAQPRASLRSVTELVLDSPMEIALEMARLVLEMRDYKKDSKVKKLRLEMLAQRFLEIEEQGTPPDSAPCGDIRSGNPQIRVN